MDLQKFYDRAYDFIIIYLPRLILGLLILIIGLWLIKQVAKWVRARMHARDVESTARSFLLSLSVVTLRILLILGVMQILGMQMTLFTALVGAFGVAAGLALSGTLQNFASGIIILLVKPFVVGDNIITQGLEGRVTAIQIFYTFVITFDNRSVIVPNSKLSNEVIINISREGKRRLDLEIKVKTDTDYERLKKAINNAVDKCKQALAKPERRIGILAIELDGYKVSISVWVNAHGFQDTKLALQEAILQNINVLAAEATAK